MRKWAQVSTVVWFAALVAASGPGTIASGLGQGPQRAADPSPSPQRALLDRYCVTCHNGKLQRGELRLDTRDVTVVAQDPAIWEKVVRKLRAGVMPPAGLPRPDTMTYDGFAGWLETELDRAAAADPNPGRTEAFHRLNRTEYQNAIRDLLGARRRRIADLLPADDQSYGFDNIAGVLRISPTLLERYLSAARKISRLAVGGAAHATAETFRLRGDLQQDDHFDGLPFGTRGGTLIRYNFPQHAEYAIDIELQGPRSETHRMEISLDGEQKALLTLDPAPIVPNVDGELMSPVPTVRLPVTAGPHDLTITFVKRSAIEADGVRQPFLRPYNNQLTQPVLNNVTITGPFGALGTTRPWQHAEPERNLRLSARALVRGRRRAPRRFSRTLARRAYRRPVTDADVRRLLAFYHEGRPQGGLRGGHRVGAAAAAREPGVPVPHRARSAAGDSEPAPDLSRQRFRAGIAAVVLPLEQHPRRRAARRRRRSGELRTPAVLERQVRRMLADPRVAGARHQLRRPVAVSAQPASVRRLEQDLFPDFDDNLRQAMRAETELFFESSRARGPQRRRPADAPTTRSSTSGWPATTAFRTCTAATSGA